MNQPRVSVLMAVFNVAPFAAEAIQSVLHQSFTDFELIVADDGSTDGTPDIAAAFSDPRIRLLRLPHGGAPAALNAGLAVARGEFLGILDGDDRWHPSKLQKHVDFLDRNPSIDLAFSWSRIIDEDGNDTGHHAKRWTGPISLSELLIDNVIANGSAVVLRTAAIRSAGPFDHTLGGCYDLDVWLRIARLRPDNLHAIPEDLTDYRRRSGQLTKQTRMMEQGWLTLIDKIVRLEPSLAATAAPASRVNLYRFLSYVNHENGDFPEARRCCRLSFSSQPARFLSDYRNWGLLAILASGFLLPTRIHRALISAAIRLLSAASR